MSSIKISIKAVLLAAMILGIGGVLAAAGRSERITPEPTDARPVAPEEVQIRYNEQKWGRLPESVVSNRRAEFTLVTATSHAAPHPEDMGFRYFHRRVEELTNGRVTTNYFPGGMLARDARDILDLNVKGDIAVTRHDEASFTSIAPAYEIVSGLFLFDDPQHLYRFLEHPTFQARFANELGKNNLVALGSWSFARHLYTRNPVANLGDLRNLKVRTMEIPVVMQAWNALGANATPLPFGDLFTGLQTGLVGGAEGSATAYYSNKFFEVARYLTLVNYKFSTVSLTINKQMLDSMPPDVQVAVRKAGAETVELIREVYDVWEQDIVQQLGRVGVVVATQSRIADFDAWRERIRSGGLNAALLQRTDPSFESLIESLRR